MFLEILFKYLRFLFLTDCHFPLQELLPPICRKNIVYVWAGGGAFLGDVLYHFLVRCGSHFDPH